mgnify:CR=1 FL=1|tara:strand:+ start:5956 stop:6390 length:435 start_codon:yes stop_codon:yes gene_type:complete
MKIEVGSIIYIIDPVKKTVVPARVNEQLVSKTVKGESTTHNIELPSGKTVNLESIDAVFFNSLDEVRDHLLERAREVIEVGINNAKKAAMTKFKVQESNESPLSNEVLETASDTENIQVTLPDGTVAKANVKIPTEFLNESINS